MNKGLLPMRSVGASVAAWRLDVKFLSTGSTDAERVRSGTACDPNLHAATIISFKAPFVSSQDPMRFFVTLLLTLAMGIGAAFLLSLFVRVWFPRLATVLFVVISLWWLYLGWRYASARDRGGF